MGAAAAAPAAAAAAAVIAGKRRIDQIRKTKTEKIPTHFYGGPTGDKAIYNDEYGAVTGVVHEKEWVAPKWMNESPRYAPTINWLEKERKKELGQFFDGGPTSESSTTADVIETESEAADPNAMNYAMMEIMQELKNILSSGIKAYTVRDYEDFIERKEIDQEHEDIYNNTRSDS